MTYASAYPLNWRDFVKLSASIAAATHAAGAWSATTDAAPSPDGTDVRGSFSKYSTGGEVTAGLHLKGKMALVTGCNSGTGLETMRELVLRGAHVLSVVRTGDKAKDACASVEVLQASGTTTPIACELSDFDSVASCADTVRRSGRVYRHPDLERRHCSFSLEASERYRKAIRRQSLEPFHATLVTASLQGRIVMVSSSFTYLHAPSRGIEFGDLSGKHGYDSDPHRMYGQSKLADALFAREVAHRLFGTTATSNTLHPGYIPTNIDRGHKYP